MKRKKRVTISDVLTTKSGFKEPDSHAPAGIHGNSFVHLILILCACFAIYANSVNVPFTFDDSTCIVNNKLIETLSYFGNDKLVLAENMSFDIKNNFILRPVCYFTFALNHMLSGSDVFSYHILNILVHIVNALLVYVLVVRLFNPGGDDAESDNPDPNRFVPFFSAAIFACHPIQTEAVTYVVQRFTSLATMFYLIAMLCFIAYHRSDKTLGRYGLYLLTSLAAVLAMKTKEISFTLPVMLLVYGFIFIRTNKLKMLFNTLPILSTMLIVPVTVLKLSKLNNQATNQHLDRALDLVNFGGTSNGDYLLTQLRVIATYLRLMIVPVHQNLDYDFKLITIPLDPGVLLSAALIVSIIFFGLYLLRASARCDSSTAMKFRVAAYGIFWFFVTLSVESSIIPMEDLIVEHRLYLPSVGLIVAAVTVMCLVRDRYSAINNRLGGMTLALMVGVVIALSSATVLRNRAWSNIWQDTVVKSPLKSRPFSNLGQILLESGKTEEAIRLFKVAIVNDPDNAIAYNNLGVAYFNNRQFDQALAEFNRVVEKEPNYYLGFANAGNAHYQLNEMPQAIELYRKALDLMPDYLLARFNLGATLFESGRQDLAKMEFEKVLRIDPGNERAREMLARIAAGKYTTPVTR